MTAMAGLALVCSVGLCVALIVLLLKGEAYADELRELSNEDERIRRINGGWSTYAYERRDGTFTNRPVLGHGSYAPDL